MSTEILPHPPEAPDYLRPITDAADAIQRAHTWAIRAAEARQKFALAEFERPRIKERAIRLIMLEQENAGQKPTYTGAERLVESYPMFAEHCQRLRDSQFELDVAVARATAYGRFADLLIHHEAPQGTR